MNMALEPGLLRVDVVADLVCPWCYVGKRRLDQALSRVNGARAVRWHAFQLFPEVGPEGEQFDAFLRNRFQDMGTVRQAMDQLESLGLAHDIHFNFDRIARLPNTIDAHRVIATSDDTAVQNRLVESLYHRFFVKGEDISDRDLLLETATRSGIEADVASNALADDTSRKIIMAEAAAARSNGIRGIPTIILNGQTALQGAPSADALTEAFDQAIFGDTDQGPYRVN